ncbi:Extracellular metalloproteinase mep [Rhizoctonia solani AG-1 IB]|uniref:Extracellular metalloproteinase n=1 Tax=Thanatephorus cucumeris (strain AG1-IB / isolate 7/3/14) TaxID=1108050 RepID=M5CA45_THACB|nr:Extracellular metalloproteinase mep [Rhizoctonia solani AG-1 IB]
MCAMSYACLLSAFVLLSPTTTLAHRTVRRSLNFRPPREVDFYTNPLLVLGSHDPYHTARVFLGKLAYPDGGYYIRKDSYTDETTGISHIYVRQVVSGVEVADGNINLNIRNGQVLSYGNSFFDGSVERSLLSVPSWHQAVYCSQVTTRPNDPACGTTLRRLQTSVSTHTFSFSRYHDDPRAAAYFFLHVAHPQLSSLGVYPTSLGSERHQCTDILEEDIACKGWLVTDRLNKVQPIHARQVYVQTPAVDGSTSLVMAWRLEVLLPENQYEAYVSVNDPSKIISVTDWVVDGPTPDSDGWLSTLERNAFGQQQQEVLTSEASAKSEPEVILNAPKPIPTAGTYRVWKWGINGPESGKRTLEVVPTDRRASPLGWHSLPAGNDPLKLHPGLGGNEIVNYTSTIGNNVFAQENWDGTTDWKANSRPNGGDRLVFDYPYGADPSQPGWEDVEPRQYRDATVTHLFYLANMYHDLLYLYGFDEVSGNFQQYNFGKGAAEGDAIIVDAQDSGGFNNANFATPPDGRNGRCRMFLWNTAKPFRDGGLDAGILIHELSHGLSTRLTGGPRNSDCLNARESGGMGEGWGDFIATTVRSSKIYKDYPIGAWAANTEPGIRHFPYSANATANPSLYGFLQRIDYREVHAIGEVWAEILWAVSNKLIEKHGFSDSLFPSSDSSFYRFITLEDGVLSRAPKHGNTLMLQLIVDGMKAQPCNPTFIQARDAIIAADHALTGGENKCILWKSFASRGLGTDAKRLTMAPRPSINGFLVPPECN